jgi:hypothetical protein
MDQSYSPQNSPSPLIQRREFLSSARVSPFGNGREYCGRSMVHPHEIFLEVNDIGHRRIQVVRLRTNGFVEQFNRTG